MTPEIRRTIMHAFEHTWDRVYGAFRRRYKAPAAELAAEEAYRRLSIELQANSSGFVHVGRVLEDIVSDMLSPQVDSAADQPPTATMRQSA
ncbi:MAG: hypothetical protein MK101_11495 [Phycisphaerales bacterium]|nr:hypothetical protein [Phycisphaerales bacterium]